MQPFAPRTVSMVITTGASVHDARARNSRATGAPVLPPFLSKDFPMSKTLSHPSSVADFPGQSDGFAPLCIPAREAHTVSALEAWSTAGPWSMNAERRPTQERGDGRSQAPKRDQASSARENSEPEDFGPDTERNSSGAASPNRYTGPRDRNGRSPSDDSSEN